MAHRKVGVWFVGGRGSVATTATVGALALAHRQTDAVGCVTELPDLDGRGLPEYDALVTGGHDIGGGSLRKRAEQLSAGGVIPPALVTLLGDQLDSADERIREGVESGHPDQRSAVSRLVEDIRSFRREQDLDQVVVVDVSSTEPRVDVGAAGESMQTLEAAWSRGEVPLPASSVYACAALLAGCGYVGFTPSTGVDVPALHMLAEQQGLPYAGNDGKTGETLLKSVLAPMFATRALRVRSWTSVNLLGGGDGQTLADPVAREAKTTSKSRGLESMLGGPVDGPMHIDYVRDLGDWKTAWDHVSFEGFLGAGMSMQFTWQGCDSALAAPLVLDLVRLVARAQSLGSSGPVRELAFFFKDPAGSDEHRLSAQWETLVDWSARCGEQWSAAHPDRGVARP